MGTCARCRRPTIEVPVRVGEEQLTIIRCSNCDDHRWERGGEVVDLVEVLDLTTAATDRRRAERS
jgi:hypothetical protein